MSNPEHIDNSEQLKDEIVDRVGPTLEGWEGTNEEHKAFKDLLQYHSEDELQEIAEKWRQA